MLRMEVKIIAKSSDPVIYNNATAGVADTWSLALPKNLTRQGWIINNTSANDLTIGIGDEQGGVVEFLLLSSGQTTSQSDQVITNSLFVKSTAISQTFNLTELI